MRRLTALALLGLLGLALAACESESSVGASAGVFSDTALPDLNGGQVEGAELAGKDVALWFWAPW